MVYSIIGGEKMNGFRNRKGEDLQKPFPGCMGRMINIFDLTSGTPRTKLLTEKPHRDAVSPICRNHPDVVKMKAIDKFGALKDECTSYPQINRTSNLWKSSTKKANGTPMKMLIAQEMSRDVESKQKPPNVVAKLMGLDPLPMQQLDLTTKKSSQELARELQDYRQQEDTSKSSDCDHQCRDVYEVCSQPSRDAQFKDKYPPNIINNESPADKRLAFVHQKFTEAKRLATDEKLLQSKEFQEALEVLSSNRDLVLKFLEEPKSLFSKHLPVLQTTPISQTRHITVLKPSKTSEPKGAAQVRRHLHTVLEDIDHNKNINRKAENGSRPTRIVVLKPNPKMPHETTSKLLEKREIMGNIEPDEAKEAKEVAKEITRQMQEYERNNRKDPTPSLSSSNGYVADESSFNRSDCIDEECGNASDLETQTPTSQHSWDCSFRLGSPCSISTLTSHSPEASVINEAKKRLSERWAVVASSGVSEEPCHTRRSSSTLGEMLGIDEIKKDELSDSHSISSNNSPHNLARSKSLPVSPSVYENKSDSTISKSIVPREIPKSKSGISSLKGKLSTLFLSKIKKAATEKQPIAIHGFQSEALCKSIDPSSEFFHHCNSGESNSIPEEKTGKVSSINGPKQGSSLLMACLSFEKPRASENPRNTQDQPSPNSVLEPPFEDEGSNIPALPSASAISRHPQALSRSPPIGSISRTLSREHPGEKPAPNSLKLSMFLSRECEEQERSLIVDKLLAGANLLDAEDSSSVLAKFYSLDSPLDPVLLEEFLGRKEEDAKYREKRSKHRLIFDCVNVALLTIGEASLMGIYPWAQVNWRTRKDDRNCGPAAPAAVQVSKLVSDYFSMEKWVSGESETQYRNRAVDELVRDDVGGKGIWEKHLCLEVDEFSREIGGQILEELVEEALTDLTDVYLR